MNDLLNNPLPLAGTLGGVGLLIRWLWGFEKDFVQKYSERAVELEAEIDRCRDRIVEIEADRDQWRDRYYKLLVERNG